MCAETYCKNNGRNSFVEQISGNMALSGMELTKADTERILYLLNHPGEEDALLQELLAKHTIRENTQ